MDSSTRLGLDRAAGCAALEDGEFARLRCSAVVPALLLENSSGGYQPSHLQNLLGLACCWAPVGGVGHLANHQRYARCDPDARTDTHKGGNTWLGKTLPE